MKINYSNLTFTELVNKIGSSRFFDLPSMLKEAFTRLANTPSGDSRPYKVYTALLSQSGTDAPVATVLENTLGSVNWTRVAEGFYVLELSEAINVSKLYIPSFTDWIGTGLTLLPIMQSGVITGYYSVNSDTTTAIDLQFFGTDFLPIEMGSILTGTKLYLPEIRVYN